MKRIYISTHTCQSSLSMSNLGKGFTLIELLIVVLIIGILAAVALPQYQVTVDKSRYATLMPMAKSLATAQESFYLANSKYSQDLGTLDVKLPNSPNGLKATLNNGMEVTLSDVDNYNYVKMKKEGLDNYYVLYQNKSYNFPGEQHCEALATSERANRLCKALGGRELEGNTTGGYKTYILDGDGYGTPHEVPVPGECTVNTASGCVRYSYLDGSGYEEFRQVTATYERDTRRDYDTDGNFVHQRSTYDDGSNQDWWFYENVTPPQVQHYQDHDADGNLTSDYYYKEDGEFTSAFFITGGSGADAVLNYNDYSDPNHIFQMEYYDDGSVRGYNGMNSLSLRNLNSNNGVIWSGTSTHYDRSGVLTSSMERTDSGVIVATYEYNSDGTYIRKPEGTEDSSQWTYGTYTTGTNGDVTRSDGITVPGSGNYSPICTSYPDTPFCN